jgi:formate hydrogenlyase subunit 6/NADH:ubiquinone oxidoreductase subunit I
MKSPGFLRPSFTRFYRLGVKKRGIVTSDYPAQPYEPHERFIGAPKVVAPCDGCGACAQACPTEAIAITDKEVVISLALCVFCSECAEACQHKAIVMSREFELAVRDPMSLEVSHER